MTTIDLSPSRDAADLIDSIYQARREDRRDLGPQLETLLDHEDRIIREEALSLLAVDWGTKALRATVRKMVLSDPDAGVRLRATLGLACVTNNGTRKEDAELLARLYNDREESAEFRCACFEALSFMAGRPKWFVRLSDTDSRKVEELVRVIAESERSAIQRGARS